MRNKVFEVLKFLIGWPLSILALIFIIKLIIPQFSKLATQINNISFSFALLSVVCFLVYFFIRGYIWKRLIMQYGHQISFKDMNFIWASSEMKRYIPGNIWSFLGRTVMLSEKGISKKDITKCIIIEIELLIVGATTVSLMSLPFLSQHYLLPKYLDILAPLTLAILVVFYVFNKRLALANFVLPHFNPIEIVFLLFLNTVMFLFFGLGYYFSFISFIQIDINLIWQLVGISVIAYLIGYISIITPSGFGVREGTLIFALSKITSTSLAGFLALFGRFVLTIAEVIFVLISYIWYKK